MKWILEAGQDAVGESMIDVHLNAEDVEMIND